MEPAAVPRGNGSSGNFIFALQSKKERNENGSSLFTVRRDRFIVRSVQYRRCLGPCGLLADEIYNFAARTFMVYQLYHEVRCVNFGAAVSLLHRKKFFHPDYYTFCPFRLYILRFTLFPEKDAL